MAKSDAGWPVPEAATGPDAPPGGTLDSSFSQYNGSSSCISNSSNTPRLFRSAADFASCANLSKKLRLAFSSDRLICGLNFVAEKVVEACIGGRMSKSGVENDDSKDSGS